MIGVKYVHLKSNADIMRFYWMKQQHNSATSIIIIHITVSKVSMITTSLLIYNRYQYTEYTMLLLLLHECTPYS